MEGDDSCINAISNNKPDTIISGTSKADSITNSCKYVTIDGGADDDTIRNYVGGTNASIMGGAGNDSITNTAQDVIIYGGDGSILLKDAVGKTLNIDGVESDPTRSMLTNNSNAKVALDAEVLTANASSRTTAINKNYVKILIPSTRRNFFVV